MLISNMTILFSNSSPNLPKSGIFGPKLKECYFCTKLCNKTNSRTQTSNMTIVFSNSSPKIRRSDIFSPKFRHFCFFTIFFSWFLFLLQTLQQDKFEETDFKYDNIIFNFHPKSTQIRHFWFQI